MLALGALSTSACEKAAPDAGEKARMSRAMDKVEAEQTRSDTARMAANAEADRAGMQQPGAVVEKQTNQK